jgi:Glycogen recognition site of AMP-activated protein kinase
MLHPLPSPPALATCAMHHARVLHTTTPLHYIPPPRCVTYHPLPTTGLGRAPATALAYMFWLRGWSLPEALRALQDVRTCSPRIESIRAATADLLTDSRPLDVTIGLRRRGTARSVQVAGLDVGWHTRLDLSENPSTRRLEVKRTLLPGSYPFKFVLDDHWCASLDHPTYRVRSRAVGRVAHTLPRSTHLCCPQQHAASCVRAVLCNYTCACVVAVFKMCAHVQENMPVFSRTASGVGSCA